MEVQGISPARAEQIADASIVQGRVDASGNLVFTNGAGVEQNGGNVVRPLASWPVGSIYIGATSTSPATLFGGGTWEAFGTGRVLVGVDPNDTPFNGPLKVGGAKTVTLDATQMPNHTHTVGDGGSHTHTMAAAGYHGHGSQTVGGGNHTHQVIKNSANFTGVDGTSGPTRSYMIGATAATTDASGDHVHSILSDGQHSHDINASGQHNHALSSTGGGLPHENLQPFITVYMWRRTA